jgi:hypothetical protein
VPALGMRGRGELVIIAIVGKFNVVSPIVKV